MEIFVFSFIVIGLAIVGMAVGVILGRRSIKGSCGGLSNIDGLDAECPVCSGTCTEKGDFKSEKPTPIESGFSWRSNKPPAETRDHA